MRLGMSHVQRAQDIFNLLKDPNPSYSVLKFGDNLSVKNRNIAQNVI